MRNHDESTTVSCSDTTLLTFASGLRRFPLLLSNTEDVACTLPPQGSLFDEKCNGWNIRKLNTMLSRTLHAKGHTLPGVTTPYLYFGMWRSTFAWHTEDFDLYR